MLTQVVITLYTSPVLLQALFVRSFTCRARKRRNGDCVGLITSFRSGIQNACHIDLI